VGSGGAGLSAAMEAKDAGLEVLILEKGSIFAQTIQDFTACKEIFSEPRAVQNQSQLWLDDCEKEELLRHWEQSIREKGIEIRFGYEVDHIFREKGGLEVHCTSDATFRTRKAILAIGTAGNPQRLDVEGEKLPHVRRRLYSPTEYSNADVVVIGAGDSAAEVALALAERNRVTMVVRSDVIRNPSKKNKTRLHEQINQNKINVHYNTQVNRITPDAVEVENKDTHEKKAISADVVFPMIGFKMPYVFLRKQGIRMSGDWHWERWVLALIMLILAGIIYLWKFQFYPFHQQGIRVLSEVQIARTAWYPSFWYGLVYSILVTVFGIKAIFKYKSDRFQVKRYLSLIIFQVVFLWILPELIFRLYIDASDYWRAYGLTLPIPLFNQHLFGLNLAESPHVFYLIWALVLSVIVIPLAVWKKGKAFCSWVCSCGALAETVGDSFRKHSPRGKRARAIEIILTHVVLYATIILIPMQLIFPESNAKDILKVGADFIFAAWIAIAFYPIWGGRVWCRFGCPLAKLMYLEGKLYGKQHISSGDHCIRCGQCSIECQMGIPVMEFAKKNQVFSNRSTSCIQCGMCITVCPTCNLQFGPWNEDEWEQRMRKR
jgi:NosR/NirI family transcriptional regulator, nitrous oxide reductase regulator